MYTLLADIIHTYIFLSKRVQKLILNGVPRVEVQKIFSWNLNEYFNMIPRLYLKKFYENFLPLWLVLEARNDNLLLSTWDTLLPIVTQSIYITFNEKFSFS